MQHGEYVSKSIIFENKPSIAAWGERFFHIPRTKWPSIIICSAIVVNGTNNPALIIALYFLAHLLARCEVIIDCCLVLCLNTSRYIESVISIYATSLRVRKIAYEIQL